MKKDKTANVCISQQTSNMKKETSMLAYLVWCSAYSVYANFFFFSLCTSCYIKKTRELQFACTMHIFFSSLFFDLFEFKSRKKIVSLLNAQFISVLICCRNGIKDKKTHKKLVCQAKNALWDIAYAHKILQVHKRKGKHRELEHPRS